MNVFKHVFVIKGGSGKEKGWFYLTPRVTKKGERVLFGPSPSSIKGWKDKFFFVDDIEWGRSDIEVRALCKWGVKKANPNKYKLGEREKEKVGRLVRSGEESLDIIHFTNLEMLDAVELHGRSSLSGGVFNLQWNYLMLNV